MNKAFRIKLYPNKKQEEYFNQTFGSVRFIFNQILNEKITIYEKLKNDKDALYSYKYKTEKEYKKEFTFLKDISSYAIQQSRIDLDNAFKNFFKRIKKKQKPGFPKFKSKKNDKQSFRICQTSSNILELKENKIKITKYGWVKFKGLSKNFNGIIKSITITKDKTNNYEASILVQCDLIKKERISNNDIGIDLGIKEFLTLSNGEKIKGIKEKIIQIETKIKKLQKHFNRKTQPSKTKEKLKYKIAKLYKYKTNFQNHFHWHLANKICSENKTISLENLNVAGMKKNRKLSHSIHISNWTSFINKLKQKSIEYDNNIVEINRWFPSSKLCSHCGAIKENLKLSDRTYHCECGINIDRDINAAINILKVGLKTLSLEYNDYKHGENIRPIEIDYYPNGQFSKKCLQEII
jgi:putative transposase